jgi:hypothetical protein
MDIFSTYFNMLAPKKVLHALSNFFFIFILYIVEITFVAHILMYLDLQDYVLFNDMLLYFIQFDS